MRCEQQSLPGLPFGRRACGEGASARVDPPVGGSTRWYDPLRLFARAQVVVVHEWLIADERCDEIVGESPLVDSSPKPGLDLGRRHWPAKSVGAGGVPALTSGSGGGAEESPLRSIALVVQQDRDRPHCLQGRGRLVVAERVVGDVRL